MWSMVEIINYYAYIEIIYLSWFQKIYFREKIIKSNKKYNKY